MNNRGCQPSGNILSDSLAQLYKFVWAKDPLLIPELLRTATMQTLHALSNEDKDRYIVELTAALQ